MILTCTLGCSSGLGLVLGLVLGFVPGFSSMSILPLFCAQLHPAITRVKLSASKHSDVRLVVSLGTTSAEYPLTLMVLIVFRPTRASPSPPPTILRQCRYSGPHVDTPVVRKAYIGTPAYGVTCLMSTVPFKPARTLRTGFCSLLEHGLHGARARTKGTLGDKGS